MNLGGFSNQRKLLRWFLVCVLLECFHNFSLDPYYEPLLWFMIKELMVPLKWLLPEVMVST